MVKSQDRFAIVLGTSLVAITFLLVLDIQSGLNLCGAPIYQTDSSESAEQHVENDKSINSDEDGIEQTEQIDIFAALKRHIGYHLRKLGQLREFIGARSSSHDIRGMFDMTKDRFTDLEEALDYIKMTDASGERGRRQYPTISQILSITVNENSTILDKFNYEIKQNELYAEDSKTIDALIREMATRKIRHVAEKEGGTQIKMTMQFDNGMLALVKPMRFSREQQTLPNGVLYADFERHTADISAFHLDRLLGFRRAFPVVGRLLNVTSEIYDISVEQLKNTFFTMMHPSKNLCFYGTCRRYCDIYHPVCGVNGMLEASFITYFPIYFGVENDRIIHPWRKSYTTNQQAIWEHDPEYCQRVRSTPPYDKGRRILDLMDMAVFDFLTGNMDRHHYEIINLFGENTFTIHYDNGRGFGRPFYDELLNLAPLVQCCLIRTSTLATLLRFHNGPKPLSQLMRESMASDPLQPVLWEPHLTALDRRVGIILAALRDCIATHSIHDVFPPDEF